MKSASVTIDGIKQKIVVGTRVSDIMDMPLPCGGHGKCGKCRVLAKGALSPTTATESERLTPAELARGVRLACQTKICGDCTIATISDAVTDSQILTDARAEVAAPSPLFKKYGVAVDVGTTTLAAELFAVDGTLLAECGRLNPQSVWGADVISRIEASMNGESEKMATAVCNSIDEIMNELAASAGVSTDDIDGLVITGNTAMLHFLTDTSPEPLSHAPFEAKRLFGETLTAEELGLKSTAGNTKIYLPPCIAAFVGADTVCALLATDLMSTENALLADIGTNGEMGLWHDGKLSVCSTAAGPAFEGVGISMGMNGSGGAIDRVALDGDKLVPHVIGDIMPRGICGSGLIDAVACLIESGALDETGLLDDDPVEISAPVCLTQHDIRMVQLAKSAICAGIVTLLHEAALDEDDVAVFHIAGGFGSYLDIKSAGKIGLIPPALCDKVIIDGNAALGGAAMLLLDKNKMARAAEIAKEAAVVDLAINPVFVETYMTGMMF
ncbi:MAG: DUF4445 domain-containing protein [Clostridia bacterium]|nr:DUF4445 domain-containing protein [Clostridia bacterium]